MRYRYLNPMTLAITAMLVPNLFHLMLLLLKYREGVKMLLPSRLKKMSSCTTSKVVEDDEVGEPGDIVYNACVGIDVFSLVLNLGVLLGSLHSYFLSDDLVPVGDHICLTMYATFAPVYRPVAISGFAALVAVCDMVYWRTIENKPAVLRKAMGHGDHASDKPPLQENSLTVACGGTMACLFFFWLAAALVFIVLVTIYPYVLLATLALLAILQIGLGELIGLGERKMDDFIKRSSFTEEAAGGEGEGNGERGKENKKNFKNAIEATTKPVHVQSSKAFFFLD